MSGKHVDGPRRFIARAACTSTALKYYTGLIETSKMHFYGRAAAGPSFSEGILRTFTAPRAATTFLGLDVISVNNMTERAAFLTLRPRAFSFLLRATSLTPPLLAFAVAHGQAPFDVHFVHARGASPSPISRARAGGSFSARVRRTFTAAQRPV